MENFYRKSCHFSRDLTEFLLGLPTFKVNNKPILVNLETLINVQKGATIIFCLLCILVKRTDPPTVYH
jgi:hypothetical protein